MGHLLCPWASHLGATVIGTVSTEEKKRIALELGCHHVINYATEDFVDRVREITNGEGVHVVYESIGKATLKRSLKCLRVRGMCAAYGHASGAPDPVGIVEELGVPGALFITRPALFHYASRRGALCSLQRMTCSKPSGRASSGARSPRRRGELRKTGCPR
jgi:NADPH2:quinone reductase